MRYFDTAGVNHHRDEDDDLFPLLRAMAARQERNEIFATLYELQKEHEAMTALYAKLRPLLQDIAAGEAGELDAGDVARFAWLYRRHIRVEATTILPFARGALDANQRSELGGRMAERRRIAAPTGRAEQE